MISRLLSRLFSAEVLGRLLVLIALQALTSGIAYSLRNTDTRYFFWICLLAALLALWLSRRSLNAVSGAIVLLGIGLVLLWILGAGLAWPLLGLGRALIDLLPQIVPALREKTPMDLTAVADAWAMVARGSAALSLRLQGWAAGLNKEPRLDDGLVRSLLWLSILWLVSAWMGWFAGRRNAVAALLPSILLLAAVTSYSERRVEALWLLVFILLLLMGIWSYRNHTVQWERRRVDYSESIRFDMGQAVLLISLLIGALAFAAPSVSWSQIREFLQNRGRNEVADTLGVQQQPVVARRVPGQKPTLPREHLLTGGYAQSEEIVMIVRTGELPPLANVALTDDPPRHYWRSATYDMYAGTGWVTSAAPPQKLDANTPLLPGLLTGYRLLHLDVQMVQPEGRLYWSGILFSADVPLTADWRRRPSSSLFADPAALLEADLFAARPREAAETYRAQSYIPVVTVQQLRAAGPELPESIRWRYLQLPSSLPERVRELAAQITRDQPTAYDRAKAIEAYLRTYPYDLNVDAPPTDRDVVDYFLFDLKRGYCDYYATAMVVLARASGLPARLVSGYSPGAYDAPNARYIVRELNAHSWPEVYFPGIGWVEFEPTASEPEIPIAESNEEIARPQPDPTAERLLNLFRLEQIAYWLSPLGVILLSLLLYAVWIERWLYLRLAPSEAIERIHRRLYRLARPLAGERTRAETALEFRDKLIQHIDEIRSRSYFSDYLSQARGDIHALTDLYQESLFAHHSVGREQVRGAFTAWRRLRPRLRIARASDSLHRLRLRAAKTLRWRKKASSQAPQAAH